MSFLNLALAPLAVLGLFSRSEVRVTGLERRITALLRTVALNPLEWQQAGAWDDEHFTRVLLASSPHYSMVLKQTRMGTPRESVLPLPLFFVFPAPSPLHSLVALGLGISLVSSFFIFFLPLPGP